MSVNGIIFTWALEILNLSGGMYILDEHQNQPKLLEFYFAGCSACNANAGNVKEIAEQFHDKGAQILDVTIDCDSDQHQLWINRHKPKHPVLNSCNPDISRDYRVTSFPTTIILGKNNEVLKKFVGVWNDAKKNEIIEILRENRPTK